jgi:hypothetical protein
MSQPASLGLFVIVPRRAKFSRALRKSYIVYSALLFTTEQLIRWYSTNQPRFRLGSHLLVAHGFISTIIVIVTLISLREIKPSSPGPDPSLQA